MAHSPPSNCDRSLTRNSRNVAATMNTTMVSRIQSMGSPYREPRLGMGTMLGLNLCQGNYDKAAGYCHWPVRLEWRGLRRCQASTMRGERCNRKRPGVAGPLEQVLVTVDAHGGVLNNEVVQHHRTDGGATNQYFAERHVSREGIQIDSESIPGSTQAGRFINVHIDGGTQRQNTRIGRCTVKAFSHVVGTGHLEVTDAQAQEVDVDVQIRDAHLSVQVQLVGCGINCDAHFGECTDHVEVAGQQCGVGGTLQCPLASAYAKVDRGSGDREDVDQRIAVSGHVDVNLDIVDHVAGLAEQRITEIGDFFKEVGTVSTTDFDVLD